MGAQRKHQDSSEEQAATNKFSCLYLERDLYNIAASLCSTLQLFCSFFFLIFCFYFLIIQNTVQLTQKISTWGEREGKGNIIQTGILNQTQIIGNNKQSEMFVNRFNYSTNNINKASLSHCKTNLLDEVI